MTFLRTIHEETSCVQCSITGSAVDNTSKVSSAVPLNQYASASSSSSIPVNERLETEDSDWDDEMSSENTGAGSLSKGNEVNNINHETVSSNGNASQYEQKSEHFYRSHQHHASPPQRTNSVGHQSFLERLGKILCNHSAAVGTCDDTSVIVEISNPAMISGDSSSEIGTWENVDSEGNATMDSNMTSEEQKRQAMKRSQEEYLLQVIMTQKQQLNKLW